MTYPTWYHHPHYKEYTKEIQSNHEKITNIKGKIKTLLREMSGLEHTRGLVVRKAWDFEAPPANHIKILEKYTGDCDECWFYTYSSSADQIEELQVNKAIQISNHQVDINVIKEKNKILNQEQDDLRDSIIEKEKVEKEKERRAAKRKADAEERVKEKANSK